MGTERTRPTTEQAEARLLADIAGAKVTHTPGPWEAVANSSYWEVVAAGFGTVGDSCASSAGEPDYGRSMELGKANAFLMAAAPDLLAACKEAERLLGTMSVVCHPSASSDQETALQAFGVLRAAIAKAGGAA